MNELSLEKKMTVKELSEVLDLDPRTVQLKVKELFPDKVRNGFTTHLNLKEVTLIKLDLEKKFEVQTELEMNELTLKVIQYHMEKNISLQKENDILKPKAIAHDILMKTEEDMSITDAAKHFNMGQKKVFEILREKGYLTLSSLPTQKAINANVLHLKETVCKDNKTRAQAVVKTCQLDNFYKAVK